MKGVRKSQRKIVTPTLIGLPFMTGAGNHDGKGTCRFRSVPAIATSTNTDTMPFQKSDMASRPMAEPTDRCVAPITASDLSLRLQAPAGGLARSTPSSISAAFVRSEEHTSEL